MYVSGSVPLYVCTLSHVQPHMHTLTCAHTRIHSLQLAADCMLTSGWVGQEMLAFLRRLTCVKPTPASTPFTLSSKTSVCSDGAAGAEAELEALTLNTPPFPSPESSSSARSSN